MQTRRHHKALYLGVLAVIWAGVSYGQFLIRKEIRIPDVPGYITLKCDFHMHTVFSDGNVWPTIRVREAWTGGLDAIAITDHVDYFTHTGDIPINRNRSFAIARAEGEALGLIVIQGAEITKKMPPGHFNAIFIRDAEPFNQPDWRTAVQQAVSQGAFITWNHPGWKGQQKDGIAKWYDEHTEMLTKGWLHGIEIVNDHEYYPQAHRWCKEKKLTLMADSDVHDPIPMSYEEDSGDQRPLTLVFAKEKTEAAIKEALVGRRTAVFWNGDLFGEPELLQFLLANAIRVQDSTLKLIGKKSRFVFITNHSDIDFRLVLEKPVADLIVPTDIVLRNNATVPFPVKASSKRPSGAMAAAISYRVTNCRTAPEESLPFVLELNIVFQKDEK